jgi:hypothetical protein
MNVIGAELVRATMEVSCKILHRNYIGAHCFPRVVSTFQFFDHQLAKIGNNNLLDGGYFRSATTADKLAREASAASASFKSASIRRFFWPPLAVSPQIVGWPPIKHPAITLTRRRLHVP